MGSHSIRVFDSETVTFAGQRSVLSKHRILIICPQRLTREGLGLVLSRDEDLVVVGMATDAASAKDMLLRLNPDLVMVGLSAKECDCASVVQSLSAARPGLPVLVVSSDTRPEHVQAALTAGAVGYLSWDADPDELVRAVYTVGRGELTLDRSMVPNLLAHWAEHTAQDSRPGLQNLSPRERQVLVFLTHGLGDRDIAQALFISVRTVQTHLAHIYEKLAVHSRTEAAIIAVREGWLSDAEADNTRATNP